MSNSLKQFRDRIGYPQQDNNITEKVTFAGGIDTEEAAAIGDMAKLLLTVNYEPNFSGGYRSKGGTEPVTGQPQPSAYVYQAVEYEIVDSTLFPVVGAIAFDGGISGGQMFYLGVAAEGDKNYLVFSYLSQDLETAYYGNAANLTTWFYGGIVLGDALENTVHQAFANANGNAVFFQSQELHAQYILAARAAVRANMLPPGLIHTGPSRGVFDWNGFLFAIRDRVDGTAAELFVALNDIGWKKVFLGVYLYFNKNTVQINVGDVITGNTSGATITVQNIVTQFGTVGGGDSTGYVSGDTTSGAFVAGENLKVGATVVAVAPASGRVLVSNSLPIDSSCRFRRWNFTGVAANTRLYGITGKGTAFELSFPSITASPQVCMTPIITGVGLTSATFNADPVAAGDKPNFIDSWSDQLFLGYPGGNFLHSGYQTPTNWTAVQGADDRALGEDITNMLGDINGAMLITTRNRVRMLYGDVNENFQLRDLATTFGALPNTLQRLGGALFLTDEGLMFYDQSSQWGNYAGVSVTQPAKSLLSALMALGGGVVESTINRDRCMYRLYFDQGFCLSVCVVGNELRGIGLCDYGQSVANFWSAASTIPVNRTWPAQAPPERIYFCGADGHVYEDDTGATFNITGDAINTFAQTQYYYGQDNINNNKYYRRVLCDVQGNEAYTNLQVGAEYDDGNGYRTPEVMSIVNRNISGASYDSSSLYGFGFYAGAGKSVVRKELHNHGVAISLKFASSSQLAAPHTIQTATLVTAIRNRRTWR